MLKLEYVIVVPQELSAGIYGFTDEVSIVFNDCEPDRFDLLPEAVEHFRQAIAEWYDGGRVATKEEFEVEQRRIDKAMEIDHEEV